ncbi:hypothetical protein O9K51_04228 [Purpureocillium lavendulum]|uniref:Uncharacterized protein n=1 Tax=Purpureocillium lavendulum TaxID=1247861 RepID=A0AB34FUJ7_9HYPO|nr:hypothetical protein O9K51_04228 [Purpureocillium lavendulum]
MSPRLLTKKIKNSARNERLRCSRDSEIAARAGRLRMQGTGDPYQPNHGGLPIMTLHGDGCVAVPLEGRAANDLSLLLSLPPELRCLIYRWVLLMSPVRNGSPDPGYPAPVIQKRVFRRLTEGADDDDDEDDADINDRNNSNNNNKREGDLDDNTPRARRATTATALLCPNRPLCGIPTSLLRSCRQVYHEVRLMPFAANEFVYLTWFASGLLTAHATVTGLMRPWQREAMRYVRVDVLGLELLEAAELRRWAALSAAWTGLRGLRVRVVSPVGGELDARGTTEGDGDDDDDHHNNSNNDDECRERPRGHDRVRQAAEQWAAGGALAGMKTLERMEVELAVPSWGTQAKLEFGRALQREMRRGGSRAVVVVVCTAASPGAGAGQGPPR